MSTKLDIWINRQTTTWSMTANKTRWGVEELSFHIPLPTLPPYPPMAQGNESHEISGTVEVASGISGSRSCEYTEVGRVDDRLRPAPLAHAGNSSRLNSATP